MQGRIALTVLAVAGAAAGCGGSGKKSAGAPALHGQVTLGVLAPVEHAGPLGARGRDLQDGASLAARQINAKGGVLGHRLELNVVDDACQPQVAYEAAKALGEGSGVAGVVGGMCDDAAEREVPVIDASGLPFLVTSANRGDLVSQDAQSTFLMNGTPYQEALSAVFWMNYRRAQKLAVVSDGSPDAQALVKNVISLVDEAPRVVSLQTAKPGADLDVIAKAAIAAKPNFVYWAGAAATGGALVKALHANGYTGTFTASAESESPAFLQAAGPHGADGAFVTATATAENTPTAADFLAAFKAAYHRPPGFDALQAYDSVRALAHAIDKARSTDNQKVLASLNQLDVNFTNFLGVVRFARDHTLLYDNRVILEVSDGAFTWNRSLRTDSLQ